MRILSWNVNSFRSLLLRKKAFVPIIQHISPDVVCLQETKLCEPLATPVDALYPYRFWSFAQKKGYSGVAVFSKIAPIRVAETPTALAEFAHEGRMLELEFSDFILINVYVVNAGQGDSRTGKPALQRLPQRQRWDRALREYVSALAQRKPVVIAGDLNVAPVSRNQTSRSGQAIDYFNTNKPTSPGLTPQEIDGYRRLLADGFTDVFRALHPDTTKYSYWSFRAKSRASGWRIDMFIVSNVLMPRVLDSDVHSEVPGSDHAPITLDIQS